MGGKRQGNILSSLITNFDLVEQVIETSMNSSGSAMAENAKWLDSIEGKTQQLTNSMQSLWNNAINSDVIKFFLDIALYITKAVDAVGLLKVALAGVVGYLAVFKNITPGSLLKDSVRGAGATQQVKQITKNLDITPDTKLSGKTVSLYAEAVKGCTAEVQAQKLATAGLSKEQIKLVLTQNQVAAGEQKAALAHTRTANERKKLKEVIDQQRQSMIRTGAETLQASGNADKMAAAEAILAMDLSKTNDELIEQINNNQALSPAAQNAAKEIINQSNAVKGFGSTLKTMMKDNPVLMASAIATAITLLAKGFDALFTSSSEAAEKARTEYDELQNNISSSESEISTIDSQLSDLQAKIDGLSGKKLTLTEAQELQKLKSQSAELERQKGIQESILDARENQNQVKSLEMYNNVIKTTAAGQQAAAEKTTNAWKAVLGVLGAVAGVAITIGSVGLGSGFGAAITTAGVGNILTAAGTLGAAGVAAGDVIGEQFGGVTKQADDLIEWYDSYNEAISKAQQEAQAAENKYLNNITDDNYDNWQKKVESVNTLQTEMYDSLQEMQGYIGDLEYNDTTRDAIEGFNALMSHISLKNMDGDIDAQVNSLKALEEEYARLSTGVDEHGNNIALSTEEYARYQAIVSQILGYNVGLHKMFGADGAAISDAQGNLMSYNSVLSETIKL